MLLENFEFVFHMVENYVGKGENADFQHFLPFNNVFERLFPQERQVIIAE